MRSTLQFMNGTRQQLYFSHLFKKRLIGGSPSKVTKIIVKFFAKNIWNNFDISDANSYCKNKPKNIKNKRLLYHS